MVEIYVVRLDCVECVVVDCMVTGLCSYGLCSYGLCRDRIVQLMGLYSLWSCTANGIG